MAKMTTEEFVTRAREKFGDRYDYSKVNYINAQTKVTIICPVHGPFEQSPSNHLSGHECPQCARAKVWEKRADRMTTEKFIEKAKSLYGDKYDYSKTVFVTCKEKVCIICPEHGEVFVDSNRFLNGYGCPKCSKFSKNRTVEDFIEKARKIHGDKYDYSKVEYVDSKTPVCIICPEHGPFWQRPNAHLRGNNCPQCVGGIKSSTNDFITKAKQIHGDKYDYSKVEYVNNHTPICIICPEHGPFWQKPAHHLRGHECPKCVGGVPYSKKDFIEKANEIHNWKYDYSIVNYVNAQTKVTIICPEHGPFEQTPNSHINGNGCPVCGRLKIWEGRKTTTEEFIAKAREVHGDKYDYSKVEYIDAQTKVTVICPEHGPWETLPGNLLAGHGCPNCQGLRKEYKFNLLQEFEDEYAFRAFLANNDINILQVILRNVEPKFEPLKRDIERALANADEVDPIQSLEQKYGSDSEDENETETTVETTTETTTINTVDLDDDDAVNAVLTTESDTNDDTDNETEPSIEEVVRNNEQELRVINRIEHMLTPEDREYIMEKFLNDKRRAWMAERENKLNK